MSEAEITARRPKNAIVILLDGLNRHMLGAYGGREFDTPNLDAFARRAVRFDRHYSGSLPCIPARHDILCGAIDFLWKPWGSIEIWERPLTAYLRAAGVVTKLVSDHPHLFEVGGENYHTDFTAWDYQRGHESDPWQTRPDPSWMGAPSFARGHTPYDNSRGYFRDETDFPGPRTMAAATEWLPRPARSHDRFMLFVDEFDPHEPFDTPEPYASMYDSSWQGPHMIWPPYISGGLTRGVLTREQARQIRACYGAKLTMIDAWLGKLDGTVDALTTNVDICAPLAEIFGVEMTHRTHGRSMLPLITGEAPAIRDWAVAGVWGREVHLIDAEAKYARAPSGDNAPLSLWSNRWSTMPIHRVPELQLPVPDDRAVLDRMPGARIPVIRQPYRAGDLLPFWAMGKFSGNHLYRVRDDPAEEANLAGSAEEKRAAEKLRAALIEMDAPREQFERLALG